MQKRFLENNEKFLAQKTLFLQNGREQELIPIKTPFDFKGDIYAGVEAFAKLDEELKKHISLVLCKVYGKKRKCECENVDATAYRFRRLRPVSNWVNNLMFYRPDLFTNDFDFVISEDD